MKKFFFRQAILIAVIFNGCSKSDESETIIHHYNAELKVTVSEFVLFNGVYVNSILPGAKVDVYENKDERDLAMAPDFTKATNDSGIAEFDNLDTSYYYLRITNPHTLQVINDEASTPDKAIALVYVTF